MTEIPRFIWIEIAILVPVIIGGALYIVWKRGVKGSAKGISFIVQGTGKEASPSVSAGLLYLEQTVPEIQDILFRKFLSMMADAGAERALIATYDDSLYMRMLLRYAVNGGNGSNSVQKILEQEVVSGQYRRSNDDIEEYVKNRIWPRVIRSLRTTIDSDYHSDVHGSDGYIRRRKVSSTDFICAIQEGAVAEEVTRKLIGIMRRAKECVDGCEEGA